MEQAKNQQTANVADVNMVARFLAVTEETNASLLDRAAEKAVGPVAVVGVAGSVDRARTEQTERRSGFRGCEREHLLPGDLGLAVSPKDAESLGRRFEVDSAEIRGELLDRPSNPDGP